MRPGGAWHDHALADRNTIGQRATQSSLARYRPAGGATSWQPTAHALATIAPAAADSAAFRSSTIARSPTSRTRTTTPRKRRSMRALRKRRATSCQSTNTTGRSWSSPGSTSISPAASSKEHRGQDVTSPIASADQAPESWSDSDYDDCWIVDYAPAIPTRSSSQAVNRRSRRPSIDPRRLEAPEPKHIATGCRRVPPLRFDFDAEANNGRAQAFRSHRQDGPRHRLLGRAWARDGAGPRGGRRGNRSQRPRTRSKLAHSGQVLRRRPGIKRHSARIRRRRRNGGSSPHSSISTLRASRSTSSSTTRGFSSASRWSILRPTNGAAYRGYASHRRIPGRPRGGAAHDRARARRQDHQHRLARERSRSPRRLRPTSPRRAASGCSPSSMAAEWASHDIQANAIGPGYIATEMNQAADRTTPSSTPGSKAARRPGGGASPTTSSASQCSSPRPLRTT